MTADGRPPKAKVQLNEQLNEPSGKAAASASSVQENSVASEKVKEIRTLQRQASSIEIRSNESAKTFKVVKGQIPPEMMPNLKRDFTPEEIDAIFTRAGARTAPAMSKPAALWIFGPSAVGKSFITGAKAAAHFGVMQNAVVIDGTEFREVHAGFQAVTIHGQENGLLHGDAWTIFKSNALEAGAGKVTLKMQLMRKALQQRQNLIIPDCCNNPTRLQKLVDEVRAEGYAMHAVCLWAPLSVTQIRGEERSVREGKLWTAKDYTTSTTGSLAMGMRWIDGIRSDPSAYCSLEMWDNTIFPAVEVDLEKFSKLVLLSHEGAEEYRTSLEEKLRIERLRRTNPDDLKTVEMLRNTRSELSVASTVRVIENKAASPDATPDSLPAPAHAQRPSCSSSSSATPPFEGISQIEYSESGKGGKSITHDVEIGSVPLSSTERAGPWQLCIRSDMWRHRLEGGLLGVMVGFALAVPAIVVAR